MFKRYFKTAYQELIRDFTSFGDPFILFILSVIIIGINFKLTIIFVGLILIELIGGAIKLLFFKERPNKQNYKGLIEKIDAGTFPSIHSARSCFVFLTLIFLVEEVYLKVIFVCLILIVGITRVLLKKHYVKDVIGGYILGTLISIGGLELYGI